MPESPEMTLVSFEGSDTEPHASDSLSGAFWDAAYIKPDFAALAPGQTVTGWSITSVEMRIAKNASAPAGPTDYCLYEIRKADAATRPDMNRAHSPVIDSVQLLSAPLEERSGQTSLAPWAPPILFANAKNLDPAKGYCVMGSRSTSQALTGAQYVSHQEGVTVQQPDLKFWWTGTAGGGTANSQWHNNGNAQQIYIRVKGTITTA